MIMKFKKKIKKYIPVILIILALIVVINGRSLAKYVIEEFHSYYLNSKHFYFTSNRLSEDNNLYQINNWSGVGSFYITFDLLAQKNSYVFTDYDITYQVNVVCPTGVICQVDKPTGTIYGNSINHADTVTLFVNPQATYNEGDILSIDISATSNSPYIKRISATYQYIVGKKGVTYLIDDKANQTYMMLELTNAINYCTVVTAFGTYAVGDHISNTDFMQLSAQDKAKCISKNITLSFNPNVVILDTTSLLVQSSSNTTQTIGGVAYLNSITFPINPSSSNAIKFYKINPVNNYTYPIVNNSSIVSVAINDPV